MNNVVKWMALFCLVLFCGGISYAAAAGRVEGRVVYRETGVEGARVYAYREPDGLFKKEPAAPAAVTDASGNFALELPRGQYYIVGGKGAGEAPGPGELWCYYGANPVSVDPARPVKMTLNLVVKPRPPAEAKSGDGKGGVEGVVTLDGVPQDGVVLTVYLDANDSFRGLGYYMSPPTGADGSFRMRMNEGTYYILARRRMNGQLSGPLREGDYFGYLDVNPVVVRKGVIQKVEIPLVRKVEKASPGGQGRTLVRGRIFDKDGAPVSGAYACLYKNDGMTDRPSAVSKPTGADGTFEVELPLGGKFYLGARSAIGGPAEPGQLWGRYAGSPDHSVTVETGKAVEGLVVTVEKVEE